MELEKIFLQVTKDDNSIYETTSEYISSEKNQKKKTINSTEIKKQIKGPMLPNYNIKPFIEKKPEVKPMLPNYNITPYVKKIENKELVNKAVDKPQNIEIQNKRIIINKRSILLVGKR